MKKEIPVLIGKVFALWTLIKSNEYFENFENVSLL